MSKFVIFLNKWWTTILAAIILIFSSLNLGCAIVAAEKYEGLGVAGIFGAFLVMCICIGYILDAYYNNKRR